MSAQAAATFTQAMTRTDDPNALGSLALGLSAVLARLDAKEAARVSAQAAATLTQAMNKTNVPFMYSGIWGSPVGGVGPSGTQGSRRHAHAGHE